jgi:hypothetical protein
VRAQFSVRAGQIPIKRDHVGVANAEESDPMLGTILIIILILALVGALPRWGHSRNWGYAPSGGLGLVVLIVIILIVLGRI